MLYHFSFNLMEDLCLRKFLFAFGILKIFFRFPELEYFKDENVRTMMSDILFIYAKHHPDIAYKQVISVLSSILVLFVFLC